MLKNIQQFFGFNLDETPNEDDELLNLSFNSNKRLKKPVSTSEHTSKDATKTKADRPKPSAKKPVKKPSFNLKIATPNHYEESLSIAGLLREGYPIVVKCDQLSAEDSKRLIDFLCGTAYAINGQMEKISDKIVIFAPETTGLIAYQNTIQAPAQESHPQHPQTPPTHPLQQTNPPHYPSHQEGQSSYPQGNPNPTTYTGPKHTYNAHQVATPYAVEKDPSEHPESRSSTPHIPTW